MYTTYKTNRFLLFTLLFSAIAIAQEDEEISFETHTIFDDAQNALSVAVADIDGDEDMDVLSASANDNSIRWHQQTNTDGHVSFTTHTIFDSAMGATSVTTADIDNDGNLDVISASYGDHTIRWFQNTGTHDTDGNLVFTHTPSLKMQELHLLLRQPILMGIMIFILCRLHMVTIPFVGMKTKEGK